MGSDADRASREWGLTPIVRRRSRLVGATAAGHDRGLTPFVHVPPRPRPPARKRLRRSVSAAARMRLTPPAQMGSDADRASRAWDLTPIVASREWGLTPIVRRRSRLVGATAAGHDRGLTPFVHVPPRPRPSARKRLRRSVTAA